MDSNIATDVEQIQSIVNSNFTVEEFLIEYGFPTFYVQLNSDSKRAFTRLVEDLSKMGFTPLLRERDGRVVLKIAPKPKTKPSRPWINVVLLLVTLVTVMITGYFLSLEFGTGLNLWIGALSFTLALLGILGAHEMAHKIAANHHKMDATMPYFIPGPPILPGVFFGIGTFGAVIVQKETAPNRDALFDVGASGPIAGFIVTILVSVIGLLLSNVELLEIPLNGGGLPISPLFIILMEALIEPIPGGPNIITLHPIAFAGWIGMFVTLLNLLPTGMLDGGHTLRSIINNDIIRTALTVASIIILLVTQQYIMLAFILFLSMYKHPGPLDDVSKLSLSRKLLSILLLVIFALCLFIF